MKLNASPMNFLIIQCAAGYYKPANRPGKSSKHIYDKIDPHSKNINKEGIRFLFFKIASSMVLITLQLIVNTHFLINIILMVEI